MFKIDSIVDTISGYLEKKLELLKIELKEDAAKVASRIIIISLVILILFMLLLFSSILLATYLNYILESDYQGFGIVSLFYFSLFLILILLKDKLKLERRIEGYLLKVLNKDNDN